MNENFNFLLKIFLVLLASIFIILALNGVITGKIVGNLTESEEEAEDDSDVRSEPQQVRGMIVGGPCTSDSQCASGKCLIKGGKLPGKCIECEKNNECGGGKPICKTSGLPPNNVCVTCYGAYIGCNRKIEFCSGGDTVNKNGEIVSECVLKKVNGESCKLNYQCNSGLCFGKPKVCAVKKNKGETCNFNYECSSNKCIGRPKKCL